MYKKILMLLMVSFLLLLLSGCPAMQPKSTSTKKEPKSYTISPSNTITQTKIFVITPKAIEVIIKLNDEELEKLQKLVNGGGHIQSSGVWDIDVKADVVNDEKLQQTTTTESTQKAEIPISLTGK